MGEKERIARSPPDDIEGEVVDCDPLLAHLERQARIDPESRRRLRRSGRSRRHSPTSVCAQPAGALTRGASSDRG